jgi:flavorubredoxin
MAGAIKDFFDRTFYPAQGKVSNKPCGIFVTAGGGGRPALESVARMCQAFKFRNIAEPVLAAGKPTGEKLEECRELGKALAQAD